MDPVFDLAAFRAAFPQFASDTLYPDDYVTAQWDAGAGFLKTSPYSCAPGNSLQLRNLMAAHLLATLGPVGALAPAAPGAITSSTIDKVSVQRAAPPSRGPWGYWLGTTAYGVQLWALLRSRISGGFYALGRNEQGAFRRAPGIRR